MKQKLSPEPVRATPGMFSRLLFTLVLVAVMAASVGGVLYALGHAHEGGAGHFDHKIQSDSLLS